MSEAAYARHDLLALDPMAWPAILDKAPDLSAIPLLRDWAARRWPVIVRRRAPNESVGDVPVAIALPPGKGRTRAAFVVAPGDIRTARGPTRLADAAPSAPDAWHATIAALLALGARARCEPAVFGSLLWAHETGLTYLTAASDLDLLWPVDGDTDLSALLQGLPAIAATAPMPIDGEVIVPGGLATHWRELAGDADTLLVKTMDAVLDMPRHALLARLDHRAADARV